MAKKRKKVVRRRKPTSYMMVIRVAVPARYVPRMKVRNVSGILDGALLSHRLEILNAYYDMRGQPNAR